MQVCSAICLVLMMTAIFTNCSCAVLIKTEDHLSPSNQQQEMQESHTRDHHEQNFQAQTQSKVKYSRFQFDTLSETNETENEETILQNDSSAFRTFGLRRRLKMAIPIIMYILGIATSMLGVLTLLSAKSLLVGLIILIIQISSGIAKLAILKKDKEHHHESWDHEHEYHEKPPQNVHVHVHGIGGGHGHHKPSYSYSHSPYSGWGKSDLVGANSRIDEDYYQRLKELKELKELRESLYTQVI